MRVTKKNNNIAKPTHSERARNNARNRARQKKREWKRTRETEQTIVEKNEIFFLK